GSAVELAFLAFGAADNRALVAPQDRDVDHSVLGILEPPDARLAFADVVLEFQQERAAGQCHEDGEDEGDQSGPFQHTTTSAATATVAGVEVLQTVVHGG